MKHVRTSVTLINEKMQRAQQQDVDDLRQTVFEFLTDLNNIFTSPTEKGDLALVEFFYKRLHPEMIMQHADTKLLPYKKRIEERNILFFDENRYIFAGLPEDRVAYYSDQIVNKGRLGKEDLEMIWAYLDTMIALAESYKKCK